MQEFHRLVDLKCRRPGYIDHAYVWNDSVILLAYVDDKIPATYEKAMRAADGLKKSVDALGRNYAIAVKGRAFPRDRRIRSGRVTVIKASSYAMADCFEIEAHAKGQRVRKEWYLDRRIVTHLRGLKIGDWMLVSLLPSGKKRQVYLYNGCLW